MPKARCWLDLAPLSPRTALQTNPLSDLDGSTELAEPPLVGMMRLPRTMRRRLERDARAKRLEVRRNTPSPVARLPCWFLRRGRACRAWVRRSGPTPLPGAHGHDVEDLWWNTPSGRAQRRAASKIARAHASYGDHDHLGVSVRLRKPPARAYGAIRKNRHCEGNKGKSAATKS